MKVLLMGGTPEVRFLTRALKLKKHDVTVVSQDVLFCKMLADEYEVTAVCGDPQNLQVLSEAQVETKDMLVSLEAKDATNLLICEIAKKQFHIPTMSVISDPQNVKLFSELGVDRCICITDILINIVEGAD